MNTKQIDYCIELAHTLNFSRAAENLFVSQPSFSYQIRLLEEEIGFDIFERSGKGASLTGGSFSCVICTHKNDQRESLAAFIRQLKTLYKEAVAIPF